jgi:hypothetical protein
VGKPGENLGKIWGKCGKMMEHDGKCGGKNKSSGISSFAKKLAHKNFPLKTSQNSAINP